MSNTDSTHGQRNVNRTFDQQCRTAMAVQCEPSDIPDEGVAHLTGLLPRLLLRDALTDRDTLLETDL